MKTKSLGVAPQNTDIVINYRAGGGVSTNVGPKTLTRFINKELEFANSDLASTVTRDIFNSVACSNGEQASGGEEAETISSIRENSINNMSSQLRCVTLQDYQARIMAMPSQFGTVFRSFVRKDPTNNLGVQMFLITRNTSSQLTVPSGVIKNNIESYIKNFKSFSDTVRISPGRIVNIGVNFVIIPELEVNEYDALMECILLLQRLLETTRTNFNDSIVISDIQSQLQSLKKIRSVPQLKIINRVGTVEGRAYSGTSFDMQANDVGGIISFPEDVVWELKYPKFDIIGKPMEFPHGRAAGVAAAGGGY